MHSSQKKEREVEVQVFRLTPFKNQYIRIFFDKQTQQLLYFTIFKETILKDGSIEQKILL